MKVAAGLVALLAVAIAVALIVMHTAWGRERLRARIEGTLDELFAGDVRVERLDGSLLGDLVLHGVEIDGPDGELAVRIETLTFDVGILPLIDNRLHFFSATADGVEVHGHRRADGSVNLAELMAPAQEPGAWSVRVAKLKVNGAVELVDDARGGEVTHIDDLAIEGSVVAPLRGALEAQATLTATWRERGLPVRAQLDLANGRLDAEAAVGEVVAVARDVAHGHAAVRVDATARGLSAIAPNPLRGDVHLDAEVTPAGDGRQLTLDGTVGDATVRARLTQRAHHVDGVVEVHGADLQALIEGGTPSRLDVAATVDLDAESLTPYAVRGALTVGARGRYGDVHARGVIAQVALDRGRASVHASAIGDGGATASLAADALVYLRPARPPAWRVGTGVVVERAHLVASARDLGAVCDGCAGRARADLRGHGRVDDGVHFAVNGRIDGARLAHGDLRAREVHVTIDARDVPAHPAGRARLVARGLWRGDQELGALTVTARSRPDGAIAFAALSTPPGDDLGVDLDGVLRLDVPHGRASIALGSHRVRSRGVAWAGRGGTITVDGPRIAIRDLRARISDARPATAVFASGIPLTLSERSRGERESKGGLFAIDATYDRDSGDLRADLALEDVSLEAVRQALALDELRGRVDGTVHLTRRGARLRGDIALRADDIVLRPGAPAIDAQLSASLDEREIVVDARAAGSMGSIHLALEVDPPRRIDDARAWMRLPRTALHRAELVLVDVDAARAALVAGIAPPVSGRLDGRLDLGGGHTTGTLTARDITGAGLPAPVDATLALTDGTPGVVSLDAQVELRAVATARVTASVAVPVHPFDVAAWKRLDADDVRGATITVPDAVLDARRSRLLGLRPPWFGRGRIEVVVERGLRRASAVVDIRRLQGGPLARPVGAHLDVIAQPSRVTAAVVTSLRGTPVLTADLAAEVGLDDLWTGGVDAFRRAALSGAAHIDTTPIQHLVTAFGRDDDLAGTVSGDAHVAGTLAAPTGHLELRVDDVGSRSPGAAVLETLTVAARWDGATATARVRGRERDGGVLELDARADPTQLARATASIRAEHFDLAPIARVAPLELQGVRGVLDGTLESRGLDAQARITGALEATGARFPLGAQIGTMRDAWLRIDATSGRLRVRAHGRVGRGLVRLTGHAVVGGLIPRRATADLSVEGVTLIGDTEPRIDGNLHASLRREAGHWRVDAVARGGSVVVPPAERQLHEPGAPDDLVFVTDGAPPATAPPPRGWSARLGTRPTRVDAILHLRIVGAAVKTPELRGRLDGNLTLTAGPDGVAIDGELDARQGTLALFDQRYRIDRARVAFDGSADPRLDIHLVHDFPDLTLHVDVGGRVSKPDVKLTSRPATYTEGQLLSYLLGGDSGGMVPGREVEQAATGLASALVSTKVQKVVGRYLPLQVDVLRFEAGTTRASAAFTVGTWLTRRLFVAYRQRLESRPDENAGEAELEYWLTPGVIIQGTAGDRGHHDADLLWVRRW